MSALVGFMFPSELGFRTLCPECARPVTITELTPVFDVNLGKYQQHCAQCGVSINPNAHPRWPELFDGK